MSKTHYMTLRFQDNEALIEGGLSGTWEVMQGDSLEISTPGESGKRYCLWISQDAYSDDKPTDTFPVKGSRMENDMSRIFLMCGGTATVKIGTLDGGTFPKTFALGVSGPKASGPIGHGGGESKSGTLVVTG